ncbi:hypothetical protein HHX47_DHR2000446 [Lentinula edodes]|nr:hypothetical protein HHX47_DHR2000446 [Lentinula edodes]
MSLSATTSQLKALEDSLLNTSRKVLPYDRFKITIHARDSSALLKHELAYHLGYLKNPVVIPVLESVLRNPSEDPMVRHEAAQAMRAISIIDSIPILEQYLPDPDRSVRETCKIPIAKIEWDKTEQGAKDEETTRTSPTFFSHNHHARLYISIDPAPATSGLLTAGPGLRRFLK